jgi:hypothetical protein
MVHEKGVRSAIDGPFKFRAKSSRGPLAKAARAR